MVGVREIGYLLQRPALGADGIALNGLEVTSHG
jgi:hypothetical protein